MLRQRIRCRPTCCLRGTVHWCRGRAQGAPAGWRRLRARQTVRRKSALSDPQALVGRPAAWVAGQALRTGSGEFSECFPEAEVQIAP